MTTETIVEMPARSAYRLTIAPSLTAAFTPAFTPSEAVQP